jgi:uncharacterized lipoprotein YajG
MKKLILYLACAALLAGCSTPPKATQPSGEWKPINKPLAVKE